MLPEPKKALHVDGSLMKDSNFSNELFLPYTGDFFCECCSQVSAFNIRDFMNPNILPEDRLKRSKTNMSKGISHVFPVPSMSAQH